jgi:hypothetical protein
LLTMDFCHTLSCPVSLSFAPLDSRPVASDDSISRHHNVGAVHSSRINEIPLLSAPLSMPTPRSSARQREGEDASCLRYQVSGPARDKHIREGNTEESTI